MKLANHSYYFLFKNYILCFLVKRAHFIQSNIIKGFLSAICLSLFIYLSHYGIQIKIINTIVGLLGIYFLLTIPRKALFFTGFFTGIFWFSWISNSLQYYDLQSYSIIAILFIGIGYGIIFYCFALINKIEIRTIIIFLSTFFYPFGFNWMKLELLFIDSYISTSKISFLLILLSLYVFIKFKKIKYLAIILLIFTINFKTNNSSNIVLPKANIYSVQLNVTQDFKWKMENKNILIQQNINEIFKAIQLKKDVIIFPETAFSLILNEDYELFNLLKELSQNIDIVTGAIYLENNMYYNATYHFTKGNVEIAKKVVLVPFGEKIPLPKYFVDLINSTFYDGGNDFTEASRPSNFTILGESYRNAICYEGTTDTIYENLNDTKYVIMVSNNAWFTPSIQPTLQDLLLKYYSKKYKVVIYHVVNGSSNKIYYP